jgi:hypothetical protein
MGEHTPGLFESVGVWLGFGSAFSVIGGIVGGVGVAQVVADAKADLWSNRWFEVGFAIVVIGLVMLWWALTLYMAHRHCLRHHPPAAQAAAGSITNTYNAPVYNYGVQPVPTTAHQVPGGLTTTDETVVNIPPTEPPVEPMPPPTKPDEPQPGETQ